MTPVLLTKTGVKFDRIAPGGFKILAVLCAATDVFHQNLVITCGTEAHPAEDPHTRGEAYDVRSDGMPEATVLAFVQFLRKNLGTLFTVLYEVPTLPSGVLRTVAYLNPHATAPHFHIQVRKDMSYPAPESP